jgi:hypothetical protein
MARSLNPIPFRTRPLNSSAPMVLCLKTRESRSLPGLQSTEISIKFSSRKQSKKPRPVQLAGLFAFQPTKRGKDGEQKRKAQRTAGPRRTAETRRTTVAPHGRNAQSQPPEAARPDDRPRQATQGEGQAGERAKRQPPHREPVRQKSAGRGAPPGTASRLTILDPQPDRPRHGNCVRPSAGAMPSAVRRQRQRPPPLDLLPQPVDRDDTCRQPGMPAPNRPRAAEDRGMEAGRGAAALYPRQPGPAKELGPALFRRVDGQRQQALARRRKQARHRRGRRIGPAGNDRGPHRVVQRYVLGRLQRVALKHLGRNTKRRLNRAGMSQACQGVVPLGMGERPREPQFMQVLWPGEHTRPHLSGSGQLQARANAPSR